MFRNRQRGAGIVLLVTAALASWLLPAVAAKKDPPPRPVDLNVANVKELEELPGVGPTTAQSIIDFRQKSGRFHRIEDLLVIRGISRRKFELMRPYITVGALPAAVKPAPKPAASPAKPAAPPAKPATPPAKPPTPPVKAAAAPAKPSAATAKPTTPQSKPTGTAPAPAKSSVPGQTPAKPAASSTQPPSH